MTYYNRRKRELADSIVKLHHWHCLHGMLSRVYEAVRCPSVCLSVPACFAAGPAGRRYRSIAATAACRQRVNAGSATFSAYVVAERRLATFVSTGYSKLYGLCVL